MAAVGGAAAAIQQAKRSVAAPSPQIRENNTSITRSEEEELRRIEAEADGAEAVRTIGKYQEKVVKKGKITQKPWFILDPRTSKFVSRWDSVSMVSPAAAPKPCGRLLAPSGLAAHAADVQLPRFPCDAPWRRATAAAIGWSPHAAAAACIWRMRGPGTLPPWLVHLPASVSHGDAGHHASRVDTGRRHAAALASAAPRPRHASSHLRKASAFCRRLPTGGDVALPLLPRTFRALGIRWRTCSSAVFTTHHPCPPVAAVCSDLHGRRHLCRGRLCVTVRAGVCPATR